MLTQNLAKNTFRSESCVRGGIAQSFRSLGGSLCPISKPQILRLRFLRLQKGNPVMECAILNRKVSRDDCK